MPDLRELFDDPEEALRSTIAGLRSHIHSMLPGIISSDSPDGHTGTIKLAIKRAVDDKIHDTVSYQEFPLIVDVPIHFPGGGGTVLTHAVKTGDEVVTSFASHAFDFWHQNGGVQNPALDRVHSLGDAVMIPGIRSDPRKLQQVSSDSGQHRSDDKHHVAELHPVNGVTHKSVDPGTAVASTSFDPFTQATKFFSHLIHPSNGIAGNATDGGTTHSHGVTHLLGAFMKAVNGLHSVLAHPTDGASMNANNLQHSVKAHPDMGALLSAANGAHIVQAHPTAGINIASSAAVSLQSASGISLSAPSVSLPAGSVSSSTLGTGAAANNVGTLSGDLSGNLPNPSVIGITHVKNAHLLPRCASDAAAAAAGVIVGGLYINIVALAGCNLLVVRLV